MKDHDQLRVSVHLMGSLLGQAIKTQYGSSIFDRIEKIRQLSKTTPDNQNILAKQTSLLDFLNDLDNKEILPVTRAFSQFLNLSNIAEQYHEAYHPVDNTLLDDLFMRLKSKDFSKKQIYEAVEKLNIELVLTAHPTEITRRTLIQKYIAMTDCLDHIQTNKSDEDYLSSNDRLKELIWQSWHTNEMRESRPTPLDEAKWGIATIEESLWKAVPCFIRELDKKLFEHTGYRLSNQNSIIQFASWMGGDRDGNPNVTTPETKKTLLFNRWIGSTLYLKDLDRLSAELSMNHCNEALQKKVTSAFEPYRALLSTLKTKLEHIKSHTNELLLGQIPASNDFNLMLEDQELLESLQLCFDSLCDTGLEVIANGLLLDIMRRVRSFGLGLVRLDIRQESSKHTLALSEIIHYLELGDYNAWSEKEKQQFLLAELTNKRPLLPTHWVASEAIHDIIETFKLIGASSKSQVSHYIISMAKQPSDVLAVILLLKEFGCHWNLSVVPLFETLDDLNNACQSMEKLFALDWYQSYIDHQQVVMIGYSDSAKDAGQLAASWAQYRTMESLTALCQQKNIQLTLFHGRGGTVGRGGLPARDAILSQPPGSVDYRLRVTEQGEMIRSKYGFSKIAINNLLLYSAATLEATLIPPPTPQALWRDVMDQLSAVSLKAYRDTVNHNDDFIAYFTAITPERELGQLLMGSRPARRNQSSSIKNLRAIPWIFAWNQCRLMLPVWLGASQAFNDVIEQGKLPILQSMVSEWPFFKARIEMLEMVFLKVDQNIARHYEQVLVPESLHAFGDKLRDDLTEAIQAVMVINHKQPLMVCREWEKKAIQFRNAYVYPLHLLQAELLKRLRTSEQISPNITLAMMMTIAGIAAGIRNTG